MTKAYLVIGELEANNVTGFGQFHKQIWEYGNRPVPEFLIMLFDMYS